MSTNLTRFFILIFALASLLHSAFAADADNWPRWRGPHDNGGNESGTYPITWDATTNVLWKAPLPGKGCSTPVVWDRQIYLTCPADAQDAAIAFDWAGKQLWQTTLGPERKGKNRNGSGSNPAPATDGHGLFVYFKSGLLAALEFDGKVRWKTNLQSRFGLDNLYWDLGSSPATTEKDVVVAVMQHGRSYVAAFDKLTGELHWKVDRNYDTPTEGDHSYATPIVYRGNDREAVLVWGAEHLTAHDAANGEIIWSCGDFNPKAMSNWPAVASPVIAGDIAVVPYGRGSLLYGIRLGGAGDVTATHRVWTQQGIGAFVPTPAEYKGRIYFLRDHGGVDCIDPATGKTLASCDFPHSGSSFYSSPAVADGKLYAAREDGRVFVVRIDGEKFEVLSQNNMGEKIIASPVPVDNRLLPRGAEHLFCVGTR
jgi:outer membrane protein assembly factor BamB